MRLPKFNYTTREYNFLPEFRIKFTLELIWEMQNLGYTLGAKPEPGFLYFLKISGGRFRSNQMVAVSIKDFNGTVRIGVGTCRNLREHSFEGKEALDNSQPETISALEIVPVEDFVFNIAYRVYAQLNGNNTIAAGISSFVCPSCGLHFDVPYIEDGVYIPCPKCGNLSHERHDYNANVKKLNVWEAVKEYGCDMIFNSHEGTVIIVDGSQNANGLLALDNRELRKLIVPASVTSIDYGFCRDCRYLEYVKFLGPCPEGLERAFEGCISLKEILVPRGQEEAYSKAISTVFKSSDSLEMLHFKFTAWTDDCDESPVGNTTEIN